MMVEGILASDTCSYNHKHSLTSTQTNTEPHTEAYSPHTSRQKKLCIALTQDLIPQPQIKEGGLTLLIESK